MCDANSDDVLGKVTKSISAIASAPGGCLYQPFGLTGGDGISELLVRVSIKVNCVLEWRILMEEFGGGGSDKIVHPPFIVMCRRYWVMTVFSQDMLFLCMKLQQHSQLTLLYTGFVQLSLTALLICIP